MPLYQYECEVCGHKFQQIVSMANCTDRQDCPECEMPAPRENKAPNVQIGQAGSTMNRDDAFWDNAERTHVKKETKAHSEEREKIAFGDKHTMAMAERKIKNYENTGHQESANNEIKKIEEAKK